MPTDLKNLTEGWLELESDPGKHYITAIMAPLNLQMLPWQPTMENNFRIYRVSQSELYNFEVE